MRQSVNAERICLPLKRSAAFCAWSASFASRTTRFSSEERKAAVSGYEDMKTAAMMPSPAVMAPSMMNIHLGEQQMSHPSHETGRVLTASPLCREYRRGRG